MSQSKADLEDFYSKPDPWNYKTTPDDIQRKQYILHTLDLFGPFERALDIGCGEGWITKDLPADIKHGFELSDVAAERFPPCVQRTMLGKYDLVLATGVLYAHYDWERFVELIRKFGSRIVLTCNIKAWEMHAALFAVPGKQVLEMEFPYREFTQKLRVFDVSAP